MKWTTLLLSVLPMTAWAVPVDETHDYWECNAQDSEKIQWRSQETYEKMAANKALEECKKQSATPATCVVTEDSCEVFVHGSATRPLWRCTALDQLSKVWHSQMHRHRDDAAIEAKVHCHNHSAMPDTCYINVLMCKNLNEVDV